MKKNMSILLIIVIALLLTGCSPKKEIDNRVVLKAGSITFTLHDMGFHLMGMNYQDPDDEYFKKTDFLEQHLNKMLIADAGLEIGLLDSVEVDSGQITRILYEIVLKREIADKLKITDEDVRKFWEEYGGEVHACQILVESRELADSLYEVLQEDADKFPELVTEFSIDEHTVLRDGDLGHFRYGKINEVIQDVAFQLKPGELSKPVKSAFGWHLIMTKDRYYHTDEFYEKEKDKYRERCTFFTRRKMLEEYREELKDILNYEFYDETLKMLIDKATEKKETSADQSQKLSRYISPDDLTEEEAAIPLISMDGYNYLAIDFVRDINKFFTTSPFDLGNKIITMDMIDEIMIWRLLYAYGLKTIDKDDPDYIRGMKETEIAYVYLKMESDYINGSLVITDEEIENAYKKGKRTYQKPPEVKVSEILLETEEEANRVLKQLRNGQPFSELVKNTVRPGFAETEGNLGYLNPRRTMNIYDKAMELEVGEYGGPVRMEENWAVFKVTDKKAGYLQKLSEVRTIISNRLMGAKKYKNREKWLEERKKNIEYFIDYDLVKSTLETGKLEDEI